MCQFHYAVDPCLMCVFCSWETSHVKFMRPEMNFPTTITEKWGSFWSHQLHLLLAWVCIDLKIFLALQPSSVAASRIERNPSISLLSSAIGGHLQIVNCKVAHECLQLHLGVIFLEAFMACQTYFPCYISSWTCMASQSFRWKRPMLSAMRVQSASVADSTW